MTRFVLGAWAAELRRSKALYVLAVFGVALGVASVLSIQILSANALSAFRGSARAVSGESDFTVIGNTPFVAESLLVPVLGTPGVDRASPVHRVSVSVRGEKDLRLEILGVDFLAPGPWPWSGDIDVREELTERLSAPGWIAVSPELAVDLEREIGDSIVVSLGTREVMLRIGALVDFRKASPLASRKLAVMDIAQSQHFFGDRGFVNEIQAQVTDAARREDVVREVEQRLLGQARVVTPEARERNVSGLLAAFRLNLTALSLVSLFVGVFLVHESLQASLVRRRAELGLLRCLGATRSQVFGIVLLETVLLGLAGTAIGLPLGRLGASLAVDPVNATLTNVYVVNEIERVRLEPKLFLLAGAVGMGGALLGGLVPALEMARRDARRLLLPFTLHERAGRLSTPLALFGIGLLAVGGIWFVLQGQSMREGGFLLAVVLLVALPLLTPKMVQIAGRRGRVRGFGWIYSLRTLVVRLHTTSFAVAALAVSVSMLVAITLLVGGFRKTLETWVATTLRADVYITTESWTRGSSEAGLDSVLLAELAAYPGMIDMEALRQSRLWVGGREITVSGIVFAPHLDALRIPLKAGNPRDALHRIRDRGAALISEPLARRMHLEVGDSLFVSGISGPLALEIAAVSYDYSSDAGNVVVAMSTLDRLAGPGPITNVALFVEPGTDVVEGLRSRYADLPLLIRSHSDLRAEILRIFDQTFAVTRLLQVMALLVATAGISLALLVVARERRSELAVYRALGALRGQLIPLFLYEALMMAILGLILGIAGGTALAAVLVYVINPATFGWTIRLGWPWTELGQEAITILVAAVLAGLPPGWKASRMPVKDLARDAL